MDWQGRKAHVGRVSTLKPSVENHPAIIAAGVKIVNNKSNHDRPNPDPTILTTEQSDKSIKSLRELIEARLNCAEENVEHIREKVDARAAAIATEVKHLHDLQNEKFRSIAQQFTERDTRTEQTARDTKVAVDAALQAAEKAVGKQNEAFALSTAKSEAATTKQIDAIGLLIATTNKAADDKINDLKGSIATLNTMIASFNARGGGMRDGWALLVAGILALIGVLTFIMRLHQ